MRLAKFLASAGVASRRACEEIIRAGRVRVDGEQVIDPARDVGPADEVTLDGSRVDTEPVKRVVYARQQARWGRFHSERPAAPPDGRRPGQRPRPACTRLAAWTPIPPA